jgi:hypothetical protein
MINCFQFCFKFAFNFDLLAPLHAGTFNLQAGNGLSQNYSDKCRECPEVMPSDIARHVSKRLLNPRLSS